MDYVYAQCARCGYQWEIQGKRNNLKAKCDGCKARRVEKIVYDGETCLPWGGDFDVADNPVLDGEYYLPGSRICGHRDCVNVNHIVPIERKI